MNRVCNHCKHYIITGKAFSTLLIGYCNLEDHNVRFSNASICTNDKFEPKEDTQ